MFDDVCFKSLEFALAQMFSKAKKIDHVCLAKGTRFLGNPQNIRQGTWLFSILLH